MYSTFSKPHATILLPPEIHKIFSLPTYLRRQMLFHLFSWREGHAVRLKPYESVKEDAAVHYKAIFDFKLDTDFISFWMRKKKWLQMGVQFSFAQYVS